jgi:hypothetical protein
MIVVSEMSRRLSLQRDDLRNVSTHSQSPRLNVSSGPVRRGVFRLPGNQIPVCYFKIGATNPKVYAAAIASHRTVPGPLSNKSEPDSEPTLRTGGAGEEFRGYGVAAIGIARYRVRGFARWCRLPLRGWR